MKPNYLFIYSIKKQIVFIVLKFATRILGLVTTKNYIMAHDVVSYEAHPHVDAKKNKLVAKHSKAACVSLIWS